MTQICAPPAEVCLAPQGAQPQRRTLDANPAARCHSHSPAPLPSGRTAAARCAASRALAAVATSTTTCRSTHRAAQRSPGSQLGLGGVWGSPHMLGFLWNCSNIWDSGAPVWESFGGLARARRRAPRGPAANRRMRWFYIRFLRPTAPAAGETPLFRVPPRAKRAGKPQKFHARPLPDFVGFRASFAAGFLAISGASVGNPLAP